MLGTIGDLGFAAVCLGSGCRGVPLGSGGLGPRGGRGAVVALGPGGLNEAARGLSGLRIVLEGGTTTTDAGRGATGVELAPVIRGRFEAGVGAADLAAPPWGACLTNWASC